MRKVILLLFIFILPFVNANVNWFQEGNAQQGGSGGNKNIFFASNLANNIDEDNITYQRCNIEGSLFTPVAFDIDSDGFREVFTTRTDKINVYNMNCGLSHIINLDSEPRAAPIVINSDADDSQELVVLLSNALQLWEFDETLETFVLIQNISSTGMDDADFIGCNRGAETTCVTMKIASNDTMFYNFTSLGTTLNVDELPTDPRSKNKSSLAYTDTSPNPTLMPFCWGQNASGGAASIVCSLINIDGTVERNFDMEVSAVAWGASGHIDWVSSAIVLQGSVYRIFTVASVDASALGNRYFIHDIEGTILVLGGASSTAFEWSNWMIGDWKKDGSTHACIMEDSALNLRFRCYDEDLVDSDTVQALFFNDTDNTHGMTMADYFPSKEGLCFSHYEGINCIDGVANNRTFNTSLTWSASEDGHSITVTNSGLSAAYVYSDRNSGFIVRNTFVGLLCPDGICQEFETSFSCPADCAAVEPLEEGTCDIDSDCVTTFPFCILNQCIASDNITFTCTFDTDCPFDNPFCYGGVCIKGWQTGAPQTENLTLQQQRIDDNIDSTIGLLLGSSTLFKFLISLSLIIGIVVTVGQVTKDAMISIFAGIMMMIFTTVLGLMPIYVLIIMLIGTIALFIGRSMIFPSTAG